MEHRRFWALAGLLFFCASVAHAGDARSVPPALLRKLTRGVNITRWFCYLANPGDTGHFSSYLTDDDLRVFKKVGVRYVRLCLSPEAIYEEGKAKSLTLPYVDRALARLEKSGLAVLFDLHDNGQMKLDQSGHDNSGFVTFWQGVAAHYKGQQEQSLVFELLNEPVFMQNPKVWFALQEKTVAAIRAIDPKRTILVTGTYWGGIDSLAQMKPLPYQTLIYSFHCYDPMGFTHQGASWAGDMLHQIRDVPFPSSPEAVSAMIDKVPAQYKSAIRLYGEQRWSKDTLRKRISKAIDWGKANHEVVLLGEFGSYPPVAPVESRERWFKAMSEVFSELGVRNCLWGYDDAMGLGREPLSGGKLKLDPVTLKSLYNVDPASL